MIRASIEHRFNCLHLYCRLRDLMIPPRPARTMAKAYEAVAHRLLYGSNAEIDNDGEGLISISQVMHIRPQLPASAAWPDAQREENE